MCVELLQLKEMLGTS